MKKQILSSILLALGAVTASHLGGWWATSFGGAMVLIVLIIQDVLIDTRGELLDIYRKQANDLVQTCDGYQQLVKGYREAMDELVKEIF